MAVSALLGGALGLGSELIKRIIPDKEKQAEAQLELVRLHQAGELKELDAAMQAIVAEAKSEHWLTANWRPITMLTFVAIVANNHILYPYLSLFWSDAPMLAVPADLWDLLKIGLGGYVIGRSGEKIAQVIKQK